MKKAIVQNFFMIISLVLILSGGLFTMVFSQLTLEQTKHHMIQVIHMLEHTLDYSDHVEAQLYDLREVENRGKYRFTIMDLNGKVIADNYAKANDMEVHSNRKEVIEAKEKGLGMSTRRSRTLGKSYLYVSYKAEHSPYILRIATPYSSLMDYMKYFIPVALTCLGVSLLASLLLASRFSKSITKPLQDISHELLKIQEEKPEFHFQRYQYEEVNSIAETAKNMLELIQESKERIEFEKMVRQEFFSNVSHELKTPITSIRGYGELLQNNMDHNGTMKKEFLARIIRETENMTNLINDILTISRLETKEVDVPMEEVRIYPLINEVCTSLEPLAKSYEVNLDINCKPISMFANRGQLKELLTNLITNAIKYNKPGGRVNVEVSSEENDIVIIVEDTGVGIPEASKQRVFERFYRVDKGRSKKVGGTGLGLSIVKHVVNYYNGSIQVESELGIGSKFIVRLPHSSTKI